MLKKLFCKHDYISYGKYYDTYEGERIDFTPLTYVEVFEVFKCRKCQKVKHKRVLKREFIGWLANIKYRVYLEKKGIYDWENWLLEL